MAPHSYLSRNAASVALLLLTALVGCHMPSVFRMDGELQYNVVGGERLAVPANYIDSQSIGSMLVMATWPGMEGRTKENFKHFFDSHISIHARPGGPKALEASYRVHLLSERWDLEKKGVETTDMGSAYGFEHSVMTSEVPLSVFYSYTSRDIYVRRDAEGALQAVMRCSGLPAPEGRSPQCALFEIFPEFPNIEFAIDFDRMDHLDQVNEIEDAVRMKFLDFKEAGADEFRQDADARSQFLELEAHIAEIKREHREWLKVRCETKRGAWGTRDKNGNCR